MNTHKPNTKWIGFVVVLMLLASCTKPAPLPPIQEDQQFQPQPGVPQPPPGEPQPQPQPGAPQPRPGEPQPQPGEPQPQPQPGDSQPQPGSNPSPGSGQTTPTKTPASKVKITGVPVLPTATSEWLVLDYIDLAVSDASIKFDSDVWNGWYLIVYVYDYSSATVKNDGKIKCTGSITGATGKNTTFAKEEEIEKEYLGPGSIMGINFLVLKGEDAIINSYVECTLTHSEDMNSENNTLKCNTTSCGKNDTCVCK